MNDSDEDAFSWAGDDLRQPAAAPGPRTVARRPAQDDRRAPTGSAALLVLGVLGGVAVLETVLWVRGLLLPSIVATLGTPTGAAATVSYWATAAERVLAGVAPLVWFGVVLWRVRPASARLAWLLLGAVVLVPWPFVLGAL